MDKVAINFKFYPHNAYFLFLQNFTLQMLKKPTIEVTNFIKENKFVSNDYTEAERMYIAKHTKKPRTLRSDLAKGNVVLVCDGEHMGKKVVYLKRVEGTKVAVSGVKELNGVGAFCIDEMYLFKFGVQIDIPEVTLPNNLKTSEKDCCKESEQVFDNSINTTLLNVISKVEYLKGYMMDTFKVDDSIDFYSQKY